MLTRPSIYVALLALAWGATWLRVPIDRANQRAGRRAAGRRVSGSLAG